MSQDISGIPEGSFVTPKSILPQRYHFSSFGHCRAVFSVFERHSDRLGEAAPLCVWRSLSTLSDLQSWCVCLWFVIFQCCVVFQCVEMP